MMDDRNEGGVVRRDVLAIVGVRAATEIIHFGDGFFYYRHNDRPGSPFISLRCTKYRKRGIRCRGRAVMSRDRQFYAVTRRHTGHAADVHFVAERELRARILERVRGGEPTPHAMIVRDEGIRLEQCILLQFSVAIMVHFHLDMPYSFPGACFQLRSDRGCLHQDSGLQCGMPGQIFSPEFPEVCQCLHITCQILNFNLSLKLLTVKIIYLQACVVFMLQVLCLLFSCRDA